MDITASELINNAGRLRQRAVHHGALSKASTQQSMATKSACMNGCMYMFEIDPSV